MIPKLSRLSSERWGEGLCFSDSLASWVPEFLGGLVITRLAQAFWLGREISALAGLVPVSLRRAPTFLYWGSRRHLVADLRSNKAYNKKDADRRPRRVSLQAKFH
jgi:hypothetical protein